MSFKRVATNAAAQILAKAGTAFIAIFLTRVLTGYLGDAGFGAYSKVMNYSSIFAVLADAGLYAVTVREVASRRSDRAAVLRIVGTVTTLRCVLGLGLTAVAVGAAAFLPGYGSPAMLSAVAVAMAFVLFGLLNSSLLSFLQAELKAEFSLVSTVAGKLLTFALAAGAAFWWIPAPAGGFAGDAGLMAVMWATLAGAVLMTGMLWGYARRIEPVGFAWDGPTAKSLLAHSLPYAAALFLGAVFLKVDIQVLSLFVSDARVAHYALSAKVVEVGMVFSAFVLNSLLPVMSQAHARDDAEGLRKAVRFGLGSLAVGGAALSAYCWAFSERVARLAADPAFLAGDGFDSVRVFRITAWVFALYFVGSFFQYLLLAVRRQKVLAWATGAAALANLALNFAFIPKWGIFGSAWASVASQAVYVLALAALAWRTAGHMLPWKALAWSCAVTLALAAAWPFAAPAFAGMGTLAALAAGAVLFGSAYAAAWWRGVKGA